MLAMPSASYKMGIGTKAVFDKQRCDARADDFQINLQGGVPGSMVQESVIARQLMFYFAVFTTKRSTASCGHAFFD